MKYVDAEHGSDMNDGTKLSPFKTVGKAAEKIGTNGIVKLRRGQYHEVPTDNDYGLVIDRYSLRAYGEGDRPVLYRHNRKSTVTLTNIGGIIEVDIDYTLESRDQVRRTLLIEDAKHVQIFNMNVMGQGAMLSIWGDNDVIALDQLNFNGWPAPNSSSNVWASREGINVASAESIKNLTIRNSTIRNYTHTGIQAIASESLIIENCTIDTTGGKGIVLGWHEGEYYTTGTVRIKNNLIRQTGDAFLEKQINDLKKAHGCIQFTHPSIRADIEIDHNTMLLSKSWAVEWANTFQGKLSFHHNTVVDCGSNHSRQAPQRVSVIGNFTDDKPVGDGEIEWHSNAFYVSASAELDDWRKHAYLSIVHNRDTGRAIGHHNMYAVAGRTLTPPQSALFRHGANYYDHPEDYILAHEPTSRWFVGNPGFVDMASEDFHLTEYSPMRGTGLNGSDIGAFPYEGDEVLPPDECEALRVENEALKAELSRVKRGAYALGDSIDV